MKTLARWLGAIIGLIVLAMLVMIGVGESLPIAHVASCQARIPAAARTVWPLVADPRDFAWRSDIASVTIPPSADVSVWTEVGHDGHPIPYERVSASAQREVVNRIAGQALPFGGTWTIRLAPRGQATNVSIVENGEIYNPIFRLLSRYAIGYTSRMQRYLSDLQQHFAAPPDVTCTS